MGGDGRLEERGVEKELQRGGAAEGRMGGAGK